MAPDLRDYTFSKHKIPGQILGHGTSRIPRYKILFAHILDFFMICSVTSAITALMDIQIRGHLPTTSLHRAWFRIDSDPTTLLTLTAVAVSYFFFSFYMNQGQTWGLHQMKLRYPLQSHKLWQSLQSALHSISLYFSLGLFIGRLQEKFVRQDYLYSELIQQRDMAAPSLIDSLEKQAAVEEEIPDFPIAA